jgi:beta-N-acetylhexosaminidase
MQLDHLRRPPFNLDDAAVDWVRDTAAALSIDEQAAQLFCIGLHGPADGWVERVAELKPGGVTRFFSNDGPAEMALLDMIQAQARVPLLVSADLEGSRMSLPFGTVVPNPLALAAVDDIGTTRAISTLMAEEGRAVGVNWSFTPVLDINEAFRSPIVATRGYGSDPERIRRHAVAQVEAFQAAGVAACAKHWPGEGYDDRDQHLVTTINPLSVDEWEARFGRLYRAAFDAGAMTVMSAHIALPAFVREADPDAGVEAFRPASLSRRLNEDLLRGRLGFNGLIVSDASEMAGATSWMSLPEAKVEMLRAGCDMVLFTGDLGRDVGNVLAALADGSLSQARFDEALSRVLGLKAALGLHRAVPAPVPERLALLDRPASKQAATDAFARAPTLVKDVRGLFPVTPETHRRVYFVTSGIVSPLHPKPFRFRLPEMMRARGFEVTEYATGAAFEPEGHDLVLYAFGEETLLTRGRIFLDWLRLTGDFRQSMRRSWHDLPTAMVSFGFPYYLYDAPRVPAYVNAYSTADEMQAAVLDCLTGKAPFRGRNPVDPFCGLEDARH